MDVNSQYELESITAELNSIINELDNISVGLRRDFLNIGTDKCSDAIDIVNQNYRNALQRLYSIDTTDVVEGFNSYNG